MFWTQHQKAQVPQVVLDKLMQADAEISAIKEMAKRNVGSVQDEKTLLVVAKKYLEDNKDKYKHIKPEYINETWFNTVHGLRNARSIVFPRLAEEENVIINQRHALAIHNAKCKNKPIPEVPFLHWQPD